jgi:Shugoshin C terminus
MVSPRKAKLASEKDSFQKPTVTFLNPAQEAARQRIKERKAAREERDRRAPKREGLVHEDVTELISESDTAIPPKTPGITVADFLSPLASQPSTGRAASKDTPPPMNLSSSTSMAEVPGGGRAGRRARAVVNYAEPNLISKMRRPTKELLDAVGKDGRPLVGSMVVKGEADKGVLSELQEWRPSSSTSTGDMVLQDDAPSPLGKKRPAESRASDQLAAGLTIKSSLARSESRKRSSSVMNDAFAHETTASGDASGSKSINWSQDLSIFEFTSSSPNEREAAKAGSISRRRSTMLDGRGEKAGPVKEVEVVKQSRASVRRKSMMV